MLEDQRRGCNSDDAADRTELDPAFQQIPRPSLPHEFMARLIASKWFSRLWALPEAVFVKDLLVPFNDRFLSVDR